MNFFEIPLNQPINMLGKSTPAGAYPGANAVFFLNGKADQNHFSRVKIYIHKYLRSIICNFLNMINMRNIISF